MKKALLIFAFFCAPLVRAQNITSVSGTVTDSVGTPYVAGTLTVTFINTTGQQALFGGNPSFQKNYNAQLDSIGSFTIPLPSNAVITPSNPTTQWAFNICASDGGSCFSSTITISGASQSVSSTLNAASPRITFIVGEKNQPACGTGQTVVAVGTLFGCGAAGSATNLTGPGVISGTFSGNPTFTGNFTEQGNNTHSGTETFNGTLTATGNGSAGNVPIKPATSDAVQYVSKNGNDSNDGLSWGTAKLTIAAGVAALPTCTPTPSSNGGSPTNSFSGLCGTVMVGSNGTSAGAGYTISSPLIINSLMVRIIGQDKFSTQIQCTTSPCIKFSGANLNGSTNSPNPVLGASGGLEKLTLVGNGSANQIGLDDLDAGGINHRDVRIANFNGTSAECMRIENDANGESERTHLDGLTFDNCTKQLHFTATNSGGLASIAHLYMANAQWSLANGQTAIVADGTAQVACEFCSGVINTDAPNTNSYTGFSMGGTATLRGDWQLIVDNGAAGTFTACTGCTASNFAVYNLNVNGILTTYTINSLDTPIYNNVSTPQANNGVCFQLNYVQQQCLFLDGSNFLGVFNGTQENFSISNANGGGVWFNGSSSGAANVKPAAAAGGTQTIPNATGNFLLSTLAVPSVAGATDLGSTALPWGNLWLGTAATNNFKFQPAATSAGRTIQINDPGATSALLLGGTNLLISPTAPTIAGAGCGGSAASIVAPNGTAAFKINVGTAPTSACTITMPAATTGWNCFATDITTNSTSVFLQKQTGAESTTSVTITNFSDVAAATAFTANDILKVSCHAD